MFAKKSNLINMNVANNRELASNSIENNIKKKH